MVKIRLTRMGNRKRPFYRVVVAEDSHRRDGRFIEILGTYDPLARPAVVEVKSEAVLKWLAEGAQPSDTVKQILKKSGVWSHWRAVQAGEAKIEDMTGRKSGQLERERGERPSKKAVARIAEEEEQAKKEPEAKEEEQTKKEPEAEPAAEAPAETEAAESEKAERSDENGSETETAEEPTS